MTHYYSGRNGDSFTDATIHGSKHCSELEEPIRPLADSTVESIEADRCPECAGGVQTESESSDDESNETEEPGTCEVVMSNGDVCGRERPCGYHDD